MLKEYYYYVFTQDTYILKNKYYFEELEENGVLACPVSYAHGIQDIPIQQIKPYLEYLGIYDSNIQYNEIPIINPEDITPDILNKVLHCYCSVFIVHMTKIIELYGYISKLKLTKRIDSELFERYFAYVLYKLNNNKNYQIDFNPYSLYDKYNVNLLDDFDNGFFAKQQQRKRENVVDLNV